MYGYYYFVFKFTVAVLNSLITSFPQIVRGMLLQANLF